MGCIPADTALWSKSFFQTRVFDTPEITAAELEELAYRANLECNFIHNPTKVQGKYDTAIEIFKDILRAYPFHIIAYYCLRECYTLLGNEAEATATGMRMDELIRTDKRAHEMFVKYHDLMPDYRTGFGQTGRDDAAGRERSPS